jgi:hypothetical protein
MFSKALATGLVAASLFGLHGAALASEGDEPIHQFVKMATMDANKDGSVSRAEFVDMMGKVFDMKAKTMGLSNGRMNARQYEEFFRSLYVGGS